MGIAEQAGYRAYTNGEHSRPGQAKPEREAIERISAFVAKLEVRVADLEREVKALHSVTGVTLRAEADVTPERNVTPPRNVTGNAERQRRYRERKKAASS